MENYDYIAKPLKSQVSQIESKLKIILEERKITLGAAGWPPYMILSSFFDLSGPSDFIIRFFLNGWKGSISAACGPWMLWLRRIPKISNI